MTNKTTESEHKIIGASLPTGIETILGQKLTKQYTPFNPKSHIANIVYSNEESMTQHFNSCINSVLKKGDETYSNFRFLPNETGRGSGTHDLRTDIKGEEKPVYYGYIHAEILNDSAVLKIPTYDCNSRYERELNMKNVLLVKYLLDTAQLID